MSNEESHPPPEKPKVAFISGHIDLTPKVFNLHYKTHLDDAIAAGDSFIVSASRGADTLALTYLLDAGVAKERITIYLNTPLPPKQPGRGGKDSGSATQPNRRDPPPATIQRYADRGLRVKTVSGDHTKRDTVMTRESDYDVLWVRGEEETKRVYGKKWRPGRVSGTERNRLRREVVEVGIKARERRGFGDVEGEGEVDEDGEGKDGGG